MAGRFEKIFIGMLGLGLVMGAFTLYSTSLFETFNAPALDTTGLNLTVLNKTAQINTELQAMNTLMQSDNWVPIVDILFIGWKVIKLVFTAIEIFLTLPYGITMLIMNNSEAGMFIGTTLNIIFLALMVWGLVALLIRNPEGTV